MAQYKCYVKKRFFGISTGAVQKLKKGENFGDVAALIA